MTTGLFIRSYFGAAPKQFKQEHVFLFREESNTGILSKERTVVRQEIK